MRTQSTVLESLVLLLLLGFICPEALKTYLQFCWEMTPFTGAVLVTAYAKPFLRWVRFLCKT